MQGYLVRGSAAVSPDRFVFDEAFITLPTQYRNGSAAAATFSLSGLELSLDGYGPSGFEVLSSGRWNGSFTFTPAAYGSPVGIKTLRLSSAGLYGDVDVTLPPTVSGDQVPFTDLPLPVSGGFGDSLKTSSVPFIAHGFPCEGLDAVFDGAGIDFPSGVSVSMPSNITSADTGYNGRVVFSGLSLTSALNVSDVNPVRLRLVPQVPGEWSYDLSDLVFSGDGLSACAEIDNPALAVYRSDMQTLSPLVVNATEISSAGSVSPGSVTVPFVLKSGDTFFTVSSASATNSAILARDALMLLPSTVRSAGTDPGMLTVKNFSINTNGLCAEASGFSAAMPSPCTCIRARLRRTSSACTPIRVQPARTTRASISREDSW